MRDGDPRQHIEHNHGNASGQVEKLCSVDVLCPDDCVLRLLYFFPLLRDHTYNIGDKTHDQ